MFTGIVQGVGRIRAVEPHGGDVTMWIETGHVPLAGVEIGGSVAVNGCCLTAVELESNALIVRSRRADADCQVADKVASFFDIRSEKRVSTLSRAACHRTHFRPTIAGT